MPYVVGDVAKSSSLCIWEGEGGRTRRSFHTGLCVFQVFWVLLRGGCVCVCVCDGRGWRWSTHTYSLTCPSTSTASRSAAKMAYKLSQIIKFMIGQKLQPKMLTISYFCSAAGLTVFSDRLERFHPHWLASGCVPSLVQRVSGYKKWLKS